MRKPLMASQRVLKPAIPILIALLPPACLGIAMDTRTFCHVSADTTCWGSLYTLIRIIGWRQKREKSLSSFNSSANTTAWAVMEVL